MIPEEFQEFTSYSSYRGMSDRKQLSDRYFAEIVNGNLVCTDDNMDIDMDGNICLVTPNGECFHIGVIPRPEAGLGEPSFSFHGDELTVKYRVAYDNDHHHVGWEEEKLSLSVTDEMLHDYHMKKSACDMNRAMPRLGSERMWLELKFDYDKPNDRIACHCRQMQRDVIRRRWWNDFQNTERTHFQMAVYLEDGKWNASFWDEENKEVLPREQEYRFSKENYKSLMERFFEEIGKMEVPSRLLAEQGQEIGNDSLDER